MVQQRRRDQEYGVRVRAEWPHLFTGQFLNLVDDDADGAELVVRDAVQGSNTLQDLPVGHLDQDVLLREPHPLQAVVSV